MTVGLSSLQGFLIVSLSSHWWPIATALIGCQCYTRIFCQNWYYWSVTRRQSALMSICYWHPQPLSIVSEVPWIDQWIQQCKMKEKRWHNRIFFRDFFLFLIWSDADDNDTCFFVSSLKYVPTKPTLLEINYRCLWLSVVIYEKCIKLLSFNNWYTYMLLYICFTCSSWAKWSYLYHEIRIHFDTIAIIEWK